MTGISSFNAFEAASGRPRTASPFQHLYDQLDMLRRQTSAAVARGALSADRGTDIGARLNEIERTVESAEGDRTMSRGDVRGVGETLHEIRKEIARANRAAAEASATAQDRKTAGGSAKALDISI